ncbi:MAG: drug/metabolite transporter (DMT)-like permease [Yoonia sp.]|jgi:drug/metabolite transporter (DMT)-like permease
MTAAVQPGQAAFLILAGMMTLGFTDNLLPFISTESSLWQFHFIRSSFVLIALIVASGLGAGALWPRKPLAVFGRSLFQAGALLIYFGCISIMPIGVVIAGLFTAPLFVLIISVIFQGKSVGPIRWLAVGLGFLGALLVIRPDPSALDPIAFLPIFAGFLYAIGAIATRAWCEGEHTLTLTAWFFGLLMLFGGIGISVLPVGGTLGSDGFPLRGWMPLSGAMLGWYAVLAVGALIGIGFIFRGYQVGEASTVAVFEYALLIFASFWAWVLWDETVPILGLVGMVMIVGAGIIIAVRSDP